jgi:hypothetical protein
MRRNVGQLLFVAKKSAMRRRFHQDMPTHTAIGGFIGNDSWRSYSFMAISP